MTSRYIYVFEFKYDRSVKEAVEQIKDRDYIGRYAIDPRKLFLIGANFSTDKNSRGLHYDIIEE